MALDDVPHAISDSEESVHQGHVLEEGSQERGGDVHGKVLHDETGEHHADVEQDSLHGVVAQEMVKLNVADDGEEEGEEGDEGDEAVGVEDLKQRGDADGDLERPVVRHERLICERDGAHARDQVREERQDAVLPRRVNLFLVFLYFFFPIRFLVQRFDTDESRGGEPEGRWGGTEVSSGS